MLCVSQVTFKLRCMTFKPYGFTLYFDGTFGRSRVRGASRGLCFCGRPRILYSGDREIPGACGCVLCGVWPSRQWVP